MAGCSSKSDELRNTNSIGCLSEEHHHLKRENDNFKIEIITFIVKFDRNNIIRNG